MVEVLPDDALRAKNGIFDGVRRGLSRLDRDRPGLVATTVGAVPKYEVGAGAALVVREVLLLLVLVVRVRPKEEERLVCRLRDPIDAVVSCESLDTSGGALANDAMSFVDAANRRGKTGSAKLLA